MIEININPTESMADGILSISEVFTNSIITGIPTIKDNTKNKIANVEKNDKGL